MPVNAIRAVTVNNKHICLLRLPAGFYALDNRCPHAGAKLSFGRCDEKGILTCPVHRYRYDIHTGKGLQGDFVTTYPVEVKDDGIYVGLPKRWWDFFY
jgi:nitrite reductase/ring-hydroxylating ferredoxin subunit